MAQHAWLHSATQRVGFWQRALCEIARLVAHGIRDYARAELAYDQRLALLEVVQIGLASMWGGLRRARANGEKIQSSRLGMLHMVAAGVRRISLIDHIKSEFSA